MKVLVMGGTRFFGVHMVHELLRYGHQVTIATRGNTKDTFGDTVERIIVDRAKKDDVIRAFHNKSYDVICDNIAYSSNEVEYLLSTVPCKRYVLTSTLSVYEEVSTDLLEEAFQPQNYNLVWCNREDFPYNEIKRQAECALFQKFDKLPSVAVRFPFVIGEDDYTNRLYFYVEHIIKGLPMYVDNLNEPLGFIQSTDAGQFLAWLAISDATGIFNASNEGMISPQEIINYICERSGKEAILSKEGDIAPYNGAPSYSLNVNRARGIGYSFQTVGAYIYDLLDRYITRAEEN